jgi:hypothetical protein
MREISAAETNFAVSQHPARDGTAPLCPLSTTMPFSVAPLFPKTLGNEETSQGKYRHPLCQMNLLLP